MGGSPGGSSSSSPSIPKELKPLYTQTGQNVQELQNQLPVGQFTGQNPMKIAGLSGTQNKSLGRLNEALDYGALEDAPTISAGKRYYESTIAPGVEQRAGMMGLGRSTALTNARATTEAQTMLPLFQQEQQRRDALIPLGMQAGATERAAEQDVNTAEYQDFLRRQGLSEQALFGPLNQLPSTFGQTSKTSSSGGGMFK